MHVTCLKFLGEIRCTLLVHVWNGNIRHELNIFPVFNNIMGNKGKWREHTVRMDEGNQLLLSITVLMQEEKELGHEKRENKRNSSKILSPDWKKKKKKKKKKKTKRNFHFLIFCT
jgi:hypothetical protein